MKRLLYILSFFLLAAACGKEIDPLPEKALPPQLVSTYPSDGTIDVTGETLEVTFTYDQNIKCPNSKSITIDNGAVVEKVIAFDKTLTVKVASLKNDEGTMYTITIPSGVVQGFKIDQEAAAEVKLRFSMKYVEPYKPSTLDPVKQLTNPKASQQAQNVYNFLLEQSGKKTLSGVQSSHSNKNDFVDFIYDLTGKHPALAGYDFIFTQYSPTPSNWSWVQDYSDISAAKEQWQNNGLVSYMWHWNVPKSKAAWEEALETGNYDNKYAFYCSDVNFDINEALKEGTWQNRFIMKDIEEAAGYLQLLEDEGIPVIWRPLHEAAGNYDLYGGNGAWFWWGKGGAEPCKKLWKLLYDQLVNVYGLDNFIWVWTVDVTKGAEDQYLDWYPGDEYVDILGVDIYESNIEAKERQYQALVDLTQGKKLVTISECGNIPSPDKCMEAGNKWSWFMVWPSTDSNDKISIYNDSWKLNTEAYWKSVMSNEYIHTRESMPSLK